jgi:two-component system NtrC family response regulator
VQQGSFREDLYYRIAEVSIAIPPLRDRPGDALLIARMFLKSAAARHGRREKIQLDAAAEQAIGAYPWPGNVRELENRINRAAIMCEGTTVTAEDLALGVGGPDAEPVAAPFLNLRDVRLRAETAALRQALATAEGNVSRAAELLGVARPTIYDLMERAGMKVGGDAEPTSER